MYTHNDTDHVHNHIVINSIDLETGKKFNNNKQALRNVRNFNDEICREHGLSVPERDTAKLRYTQAEKALIEKDQYSWKDDLREKIENAKDHTSDFKSFSEHLEKSGIEFKVRGKNVSYKPENVNKWVRGKTLGEDYDKGALEYEFEKRKEQSVHDFADKHRVNWDAIERETERLKQERIKRTRKTEQIASEIHYRTPTQTDRTRNAESKTNNRLKGKDEGLSR